MIPGSCTVVVPELAQNRLQRLFTAHPAIRQAITVIAMSRKIEHCLWAPYTLSYICAALSSDSKQPRCQACSTRSERHPVRYMNCFTAVGVTHLPQPMDSCTPSTPCQGPVITDTSTPAALQVAYALTCCAK